MKRERVDRLLVARQLAPSRTRARTLIEAGKVFADGVPVARASDAFAPDVALTISELDHPYVSRGGLKLKGAIDAFGLKVKDFICADIGASTGGFTDCLLQEGAKRVHAIDVGYGQLHEKLRGDPRVISRERVNARCLTHEDLPEPVNAVVIDVSFISLRHVLPSVLPKLLPG